MQADESTDTAIELEIAARTRQLDAFEVGRVLPAPARRMVGPFAFFDHMGPAHLEAGLGMDVRPHPHIGLATVTYLFDGEILHRDSVGSLQAIRPGAVNWMTAGRGIVHSERTPAESRAQGPRLHGLQLWVALPRAAEESEPAFSHHPAETIPELSSPGVRLRVLAGSAYGVTAPTPIASPLVYVEALLEPGAKFELPPATERAVYVVEGELRSGDRIVPPRTMAVLRRGAVEPLTATVPTRVALIGGEPLEEPRYIWWNFVSSSQDRIKQAAQEWKEQRFARVPGDELEFIPLVDEPKFAHA
ncbi:pirin family protein [Nannocystis bainbridge]|uniref:Pirin family protein n=1 Tax=Nannocystis bainbridge TaxID=2995303 RepID=A0ABT5ECB6_9BACT|nr:pirin family protein [Nannocystis bainbridge]MDC0722553.1 pirin family protein [Nannocystis bainbridge]